MEKERDWRIKLKKELKDADHFELEDLTDILKEDISYAGFQKDNHKYKDATTEVGALILTVLRVTGGKVVSLLCDDAEIPIRIDPAELASYYGEVCSFFVEGEPIARPRQRHGIHYRNGGKPYIQSYTSADHAVHSWKQSIYWQYKRQKVSRIETGPLIVDIDFFFSRPKSKQGAGCPEQAYLHDVKPDRDNLDKAVLDALTKAGAWKDDCKVAGGRIMKYWVAKGGEPGAKITIRRAV
jgi:Holliday junction resolvase RusA-like endonuclease